MKRPAVRWLRAGHARDWLYACMAVLALLLCTLARASDTTLAADPPPQAGPAHQVLTQATLLGRQAEQSVTLPHRLAPQDFAPEGDRVRYRLSWTLAEAPMRPQAVMVNKLSLSGRLFVNGQLLGDCGNAPLEQLRCLHQPHLFTVPAALLHAGSNQLEFEIHATGRQMNGLGTVRVGPADHLFENFYAWRSFVTVDLQLGLIWLSTLLGLLSLTVGVVLRQERVFIWFGLTSLVNALAALNGVVVHPRIDIDVYNWLVFWSRLVSVPLAFLTLLAIFGKDSRLLTRLLVSYSLLCPIVIALSANNRTVAFGLYAPLVLGCPFLIAYAVRWCFLPRATPIQWVSTLMMLLLFSGGVIDWLRLGGQTSFEGLYISAYTYSGMLVTVGLLLLGRLAAALAQSQRMRALLEQQVAQRIAYEVTENIPVGTFTINTAADGSKPRFSFISRRFAHLTGLPAGTGAQGLKSFIRVIHPQDRAAFLACLRQAQAQKTAFSKQLRIVQGAGTRWVHIESASRDRGDGSTVWEGVLIDETEQVLAHEAAERDRAALQSHLLAQSRMQEREELLRDMHDGFGSQLASVRLMVERGRVTTHDLRTYLQEVSADLHLVVDTLSQSGITLEEAMHDMRYRTEKRLAHSGLSLAWHIDLAQLPALSSRTILQVLRVMQEALHNCLRHAQASAIVLSARFDARERMLSVSVRDNGQGIGTQPRPGRGLANMRQRAREVGGHLTIEPLHPGTRIELVMPLRDMEIKTAG